MIWQRIFEADDPRLAEVAEALLGGEIAIVPTETVYGLASTLHPDALLKVFLAKGRPEHKPLIVGVLDAEMARRITAIWPEEAEALAQAFWPGPLSLVLPKADGLPLLVTAGGTTVAVRAPEHPITLSLIRRAGEPLVLSSANLAGAEPPLTAREGVAQLGLHPRFVVDSGPSRIGRASTVYDVTTHTILRQGSITDEDIRQVLA